MTGSTFVLTLAGCAGYVLLMSAVGRRLASSRDESSVVCMRSASLLRSSRQAGSESRERIAG